MIRKAVIVVMMIVISFSAYASSAQMQVTLVKIINQLQGVKVLIEQAKHQQANNSSVTIHFDNWIDGNGVTHHGLHQDIDMIQQALIKMINQEKVGPRVFKPMQNDFIGKDHV